jgi:2'-5' RNA ligase
LRLFFALWPDAITVERVADAAVGVALAGDARFVPRENYHATLAFVGEVAESQFGVLQRIGAGRRARDCTIEFDRLEYWAESRVVVAVASGIPSGLRELWTGLQLDLLREGLIEPPRAPLRLHVTLARKVVQAPVLAAMSPFSWSVRSLSLVRSDTSGKQSVYTVVDTWPLLYETSHP